MATKRQITLRFKDEYAKASKKDKGVILDRMCETLKIGRSTARRRLKEAGRAGEGREAPRERPKRYSDRSRLLLEQVWLLMDLPCAKYMKEMLPQWIPTLLEAGELRGFDTATVDELLAMSAATMDRYLKPVRDAANPKGMASTRPAGELLRNSITIRKAGDELDGLPGNVEADTVAHCGPSLKGEFCRTLTVVDFATGWTENASARNNAYRNLSKAEAVIEERLPFAIRSYDNDNGSEVIKLDFISHLHTGWNRPGAGHTGRTTKPPSSRATTTSSAGTRSTTGTSPPNSTCSMSYGSSCGSRRTCSPHPRNPSDGPAPATDAPSASTTSR